MKQGDANVVFFIHIPKTGGMSLKSLLVTAFGRRNLYPVHLPTPENHDALSVMSDFSQIRCVTGHWDFSPALKNTRLFPITMLREPTARLVSHYYYFRRTNNLHNRFWHKRIHDQQLDLNEFYSQPDVVASLENIQTRQIAGFLYSKPADRCSRPPDDILIDKASKNLARCNFVGVTERFSDSVRVLQNALHLPVVRRIPFENRRPATNDRDVVDNNVLGRLCELDRALYSSAVRSLNKGLHKFEEDGSVN